MRLKIGDEEEDDVDIDDEDEDEDEDDDGDEETDDDMESGGESGGYTKLAFLLFAYMEDMGDDIRLDVDDDDDDDVDVDVDEDTVRLQLIEPFKLGLVVELEKALSVLYARANYTINIEYSLSE